MKNAWKYRTTLSIAIAGLLMVGAGLSLAMLSDPHRYSDNVRYDHVINTFAGGGFVCVIIGVALFLLAISHMKMPLSPEKQRRTNAAIGMGLIIQLAGIVLIQIVPGQSGFGLVLLLTSLLLFALGAVYYAQAKGYSRSLGLLGFLGVFGLIVLILLPVRLPSESPENAS